MKNKNKTVWGDRFKKSTSKVFEQIGASIDIDKKILKKRYKKIKNFIVFGILSIRKTNITYEKQK